MNKYTKKFFLRPMLIQEAVIYGILVPNVIFFFLKICPGLERYLPEIVTYVIIQTIFSMALGMWVKYHFVSPAIRLMSGGPTDESSVRHALRSASILPFAEAVLIYFRWAGIAWCAVVLPLYFKGAVSFELMIFGGNILGMTGISSMALFYLLSENSLGQFYQAYNPEKYLNSRAGTLRLGLNRKLLMTILLIVIPPIGNLVGIIYLSIFTGLDLSTIQTGFLLILLQAVFMTFVNSVLLMKGTTSSVACMSCLLKGMARGEGDLTKRLSITRLDETGELAFWFNSFMDDLERIIIHIREVSLQLHQTIEQVNSGSQVLSRAAQEQAVSVEEISASIEEMNGGIRQNADLITGGRQTSEKVTLLIDQTRQVFEDLINAVSEINQDSHTIGNIVVTVNEVAFHTNLLALNASVEAARAGEHGRGFAVVAGEVRSLAGRSAWASSEIKSLIEGTVIRIRAGDQIMKKTAESLEELVNCMESFFSMMEAISTSSTEQIRSISQLNCAVIQIDSSIQDNASSMEELAGTAENLRTMAGVLAEDVRRFKTSESL
ncbi:MAG TPA: methyl-accepting chemotaxis protein [Deltaproteobacteria bacterium]|nr:methyl-accepting chemotaxis protein [Deltaproteobacteria bacterium]